MTRRKNRQEQMSEGEGQTESRSQAEVRSKLPGFSTKKWQFAFVIIPIVLALFQALFIFHSTNQIRYEELAESVRNVFWLQNRTIYDGVSSNVGWYGTLLLLYRIFGFHLFLAKYFRLFLQLVSLICLALTLKKFLGIKKSIIPLVTIALSPTILFFNVLQTSYALDLQFLPICIYLIISIDAKKSWSNIAKLITLGVVSMIAWMSYPTFIFYLPGLCVGLFYKLAKSEYSFFELIKEPALRFGGGRGVPIKRKKRYRAFLILTFAAFLVPFLIILLWVKNPQALMYDPITKRGLFRGSGSFQFDGELFASGISGTLQDLFAKGTSYYFEIPHGEFTQLYPLIGLIVTIGFSLYLLLKRKELRMILGVVFLTMITNIILANFTFDSSYMPGIRRMTPVVAGFYFLFCIAWGSLFSMKWREKTLQWILIGALLLIPLHHALVYIPNYQALSNPSQFKEVQWFVTQSTPQASLNNIVAALHRQDIRLACLNEAKQPIPCRYPEVFAAASLSCYHNPLCHHVLGYDFKSNQFIPLSVSLWEEYYFDH